jgi:hypothetical protein
VKKTDRKKLTYLFSLFISFLISQEEKERIQTEGVAKTTQHRHRKGKEKRKTFN